MRHGLVWVGTSREDVQAFPEDVKDEVGYALWIAESGGKHSSAKPLQGFGGASVLEIVASDDDRTYRVVYTVKLADAIYVLHAFQKKSRQGISTPPRHLKLVAERLRDAERLSAAWLAQQRKETE